MNVNQYINQIARNVKCGGAKKKEIRKQLLMDIDFRLEQGEELEHIISQMGTAKEIADSFNEELSEQEKKVFVRNRGLKIVTLIAAVLVLAVAYLYWILPKSTNIEKSVHFDRAQVEESMRNTIELLDAGDYSALQAASIKQLEAYMTQGEMETAKAQISADWGARQSFGAFYLAEITQKNEHYVIGEVTVAYDNINVTYRLTYDRDMRLAGIYMR